MLRELLAANRETLIERCRVKVARRFQPAELPTVVDHGVPLLLQQLIDTLRREESMIGRPIADEEVPTPSSSAIGRAAALHGAELLRLGYTIDQVVHEYGDVCQAVTELAVEQKAVIGANEFRTLNRCLDDAIADAVTAFGSAHQVLTDGQAEDAQQSMELFLDEHRRLVAIAIQAYAAIKTGSVGLTGATGTLLSHTLDELNFLAERALPDPRPALATTTVLATG